MKKTDFKVNFWGTQGSTSVSYANKTRYGTNTPCVSVECADHVFVFDMGTGLLPFSNYFLKKYQLPKSIDIFISHYHLDHIEGLPFAGLTYNQNVSIRFHGQHIEGKSPAGLLSGIFAPPYFPTELIKESQPGRFIFEMIHPGQASHFAGGAVTVENLPVPHPGGSLSFKLSYNGKSFCYLSDFEYRGQPTSELKSYLKGSDLTAFDAYFSDDNFIPGWGHSTWEQGVEIWREAGLKKMAMYHHHIACSDEELDVLEAKLKAVSEDLFIAKDGMELYI